MQKVMEILPKQISLFGETELMCLQADFHANHTALPENAKGKKMNATCGQRCLEQYEKFPRHTLWGKTFMGLLIGTGDWFSMRCKLTWKLKGTKYSRLYFQLVPLVRHIGEKEYGLWPTPASVQRDHPERVEKLKATGATTMMSRAAGENRPNSILDQAMFNGLIPTPRANKVNGCNLNSEKLATRNKGNLEETVAKWVTNGMLPTPDAASGKTGYMGKNREGKQQNLETVIRNSEPGLNSQLLNPQFVAEMMGFPTNWTELPFLSGETKASKPMEMQ